MNVKVGDKEYDALIVISDKLVGVWWLVLADKLDWLCGITEIEPDQTYEIAYRFRYHKDDKIFDSKDRRSTTRLTVSGTRAFCIASLRQMTKDMKAHGAIGEVDEILVHDGDVHRFLREFEKKPWCFMRRESGAPVK